MKKNNKKGNNKKENIEEKLKFLERKRTRKRILENSEWNRKFKLNVDILGEIFTFLKTEDLFKVRKVCHLFKKAYEKSLWKYNIDLNKWSYKLRDKDLRFFKNCTILNLKLCYYLTSNCLQYIKNVSILKAPFLENEDLKELKNIKKLDISNSNITDLSYLNLDKLEEIDLSHCYYNISYDSMKLLEKKGIKVIRRINSTVFDFKALYPSIM